MPEEPQGASPRRRRGDTAAMLDNLMTVRDRVTRVEARVDALEDGMGKINTHLSAQDEDVRTLRTEMQTGLKAVVQSTRSALRDLSAETLDEVRKALAPELGLVAGLQTVSDEHTAFISEYRAAQKRTEQALAAAERARHERAVRNERMLSPLLPGILLILGTLWALLLSGTHGASHNAVIIVGVALIVTYALFYGRVFVESLRSPQPAPSAPADATSAKP